jgi:hypothetical protein
MISVNMNAINNGNLFPAKSEVEMLNEAQDPSLPPGSPVCNYQQE